MAWEVDTYHQHILRELEQGGVEVHRPELEAPVDALPSFQCNECQRRFSSRQQLAAHAYRKQGIVSQERLLIQSTVCGGCLTDFHTTWRVQQHLRYRPNGCWDQLEGAKLPDEPATICVPPHLRNIKRLPAVRRHAGPIRPTSVQRQRIALGARIQQLRAEGADDFVWWIPTSQPALMQQTFNHLDGVLRQWIDQPEADEIDFQNNMFAALLQFPEPDMKMGRLFVEWVEHRLHDALPEDADVDKLILLEEAYMNMLADMPTWILREEVKRLTRTWEQLPPDEPEIAPMPPPQRRRVYDRCHPVVLSFADLYAREQLRKQWRILSRPSTWPRTPSSACYYIVHLYLGRRLPMICMTGFSNF